MADERTEPEGRRREEARDTLRDELREVVGDDAAARAERRGGLDSALEAGGRPRSVRAAFDQSRTLIAIAFFVALITGALIALVTGVWWAIVVALALHALGTTVVVGTAFSLAGQAESPGATRSAALEDRGVRNPDAALNEAVDAAAVEGGEGEAERVSEERHAVTPSRTSQSTGRRRDG